MRKIKINRAQCLKCGEIIESKLKHDFVWCDCGTIFVDGGRNYLRRGGDSKYLKELSEFYDYRRKQSRIQKD